MSTADRETCLGLSLDCPAISGNGQSLCTWTYGAKTGLGPDHLIPGRGVIFGNWEGFYLIFVVMKQKGFC